MKHGEFRVQIGKREFLVRRDNPNVVQVDGKGYRIDFKRIGKLSYSLLLEGRVFRIEDLNESQGSQVRRLAESLQLSVNGKVVVVRIQDERASILERVVGSHSAVEGSVTVSAPMPGMVVRLECEPGVPVRSGQGLLVLEAMKMENEIRSPEDGIVESVLVKVGAPVEKGATLVTIRRKSK